MDGPNLKKNFFRKEFKIKDIFLLRTEKMNLKSIQDQIRTLMTYAWRRDHRNALKHYRFYYIL